jgi:NADH:ubiquinone oxidoreductase subunit 6 (subunit J)
MFDLAFYILAVLIVGSALMVVTLRNIFHSALFLVLCLFSVAGIYVLLEAEFIAAVQVLIYVGAVTILILFAVMLTHQLSGRTIRQVNDQPVAALLIVLSLLVLTLLALSKTAWEVASSSGVSPSATDLGRALMTIYVLPFEVVSVVLLVALIGAIVISRRE